jgi:GNAT superfamily N-acetyltransferase
MASPVLALPAATERHRIEAAGGRVAIVRLSDAQVVGSMDVAIEGGVLGLHSVCIDEAARGYGAGTDAVRLALAAATPECRVAIAFAPPDNGLAVYFWTRMGFSPRFGRDPRGLRFERELA